MATSSEIMDTMATVRLIHLLAEIMGSEFFRAGITAVIKKWLNNGCQESPENIMEIIDSEYKNRV